LHEHSRKRDHSAEIFYFFDFSELTSVVSLPFGLQHLKSMQGRRFHHGYTFFALPQAIRIDLAIQYIYIKPSFSAGFRLKRKKAEIPSVYLCLFVSFIN
jgi:hypothetical protein